MSSFAGSFTAVSQKSEMIQIQPKDNVDYSLIVGGGDSFIGKIVFQKSLNGFSWEEIASYTGTSGTPLTGTVVSSTFLNDTVTPTYVRFFCDSFSTSPASDAIAYTLADVAGPIAGLQFTGNSLVDKQGNTILSFIENTVQVPVNMAVAGNISLANSSDPGAVTNEVRLLARDSADNTSTLHIRSEQAVEAIGTFTASNKFKIYINNVAYWIQLDAV